MINKLCYRAYLEEVSQKSSPETSGKTRNTQNNNAWKIVSSYRTNMKAEIGLLQNGLELLCIGEAETGSNQQGPR